MSALIIEADGESQKLIKALARKLGGRVVNLNQNQYEDILLGLHMENVKTGVSVSRESVMKKLAGK